MFRRDASGVRVAVYDWELATLAVPQHDLAELLCYTLTDETPRAEVDKWVDLHRETLAVATGADIPAAQWREGFRASLFDLVVNRFALTLAAHTFRHYAFMERVNRTVRHLIELEGGV